MKDAVILAISSFPSPEVARQIGTELVERQYAACIQLLPGAESIYRWEGKLCHEPETIALIKTTRAALPDLADALRALHPYECPELLVFPADGGLPAYLEWVAGAARPAGNP